MTDDTNIQGLDFSAAKLEAAVAAGQVYARKHNEYPYTIYNYSDEVTFSNNWNEVTLACRGLILDENYNVIARPWKKFFNLGQMAMEIQPTDPCEVMDKADGSLGILYPTPDGGWAVSTRGSFHSDQAEHATKLLNDKYLEELKNYETGLGSDYLKTFTFLFEIVYPENQIVLDYDKMDDLILLGAVGTYTGYYYGPRTAACLLIWSGPVVKVFDHKSISEALGDTGRENAEGFVLRSHNYMVKIKQPDYLDKHRLRFHLTPKNIWETLARGEDLKEMVKALPDEFQKSVMAIGDEIEKKFVYTAIEVSREWEQVRALGSDRREFAAAAQKMVHTPALFSLLDNKSFDTYIWKLIKPKVEKD